MAGFPPVDQLYYEHPSLRLGGFLAYALEHYESGLPQFNLIPGESRYAQVRHQRFASLTELSGFLRASHQDRHYYRGQTTRRRVTYSGRVEKLVEAFPALDPLSITFESLVPTLFRSQIAAGTGHWERYRYPTPLDTLTAAVRAIARSDHEEMRNLLAEFLMELRFVAVGNLLVQMGFDPRGGRPQRVPLSNLGTTFAKLVSLSQHYEFASCMIDITSNPDVAVWFATHSWSGEPVVGDREAVVYRFDADAVNAALQKELLAETPAQLAIYSTGFIGLVDIGHLSPAFGLRPQRQFGGSILGLENSSALYVMDVHCAIEVFTFPVASGPRTQVFQSKEELAPTGDPLLKVFDPAFRDNTVSLTAIELASIAREIGLSGEDAELLERARAQRLI